MRIHPEGREILAVLGGALAMLTLGLWTWLPAWLAVLLSLGFLLLFLFVLQFFRHPKRVIPSDEKAIVAPADGKVVVDETVYEGEYLKDNCRQVSIFMGPFDVHLNRWPVDGRLAYYQYHPGQYLAAYNPKSSALNEQNTIGIEAQQGVLAMRQIAGVMARRIRFYLEEGKCYHKGEPLGFIRFGSRMDIFLPLDVALTVSINQQVYAGETIMAYWA
jgi:phosphatidylserine decarboxylase